MTMTTEEKLTDEQAEAMLKILSKHFHEPVKPISAYCKALNDWGRCIGERAERLRQELFPNLNDYDKSDENRYQSTPESKAQRVIYDAVMKNEANKDYKYSDLYSFEMAAQQVNSVFLKIRKSNLLYRTLYFGQKLRTLVCPEHKGTWSGIEWKDNQCPHGCQLTGWIYEPEDEGKPLPGVVAVVMTPTGEAPGEVVVTRSVGGEVLGKGTYHELTSLDDLKKSV